MPFRVDFFSKVVKQTGSNNCEQGGKNFKIVKRSCSLNRYYRVPKQEKQKDFTAGNFIIIKPG